jgi:hypothetical protein
MSSRLIARCRFLSILKSKNVRLQTGEKQFVATAGNPKQSLYLVIYLSVILTTSKKLFNFSGQPKEEAGSAGGQPASNKADTYTVIMSSQLGAAHFYLLPVSHMASKNS